MTRPGERHIGLSLSLTLVGLPPDKTTALGPPDCLISGARIALAKELAASASASPKDCYFGRLGPNPVIAGKLGGSSLLSWFPDMIERAHRRNCGKLYLLLYFSFNSETTSSTLLLLLAHK